ncbi:MAG: hypothetical protein K6L74_07885 [Neptuniibacter sp.]
MKHPTMRTKSHPMTEAKHLNMMRQNLLFRGFMVETERGAVCKNSTQTEVRSEDQR